MEKFFAKIYKNGFNDFFKVVNDQIKHQKKMFIVTANPEIYSWGNRDSEYRDILLASDTTIVADGIGIVKGASFIGVEIAERIPGVDLIEALFGEINSMKGRLCLLGAKQEVLDDLLKVISVRYPSIDVVYARNGYAFSKEEFNSAVLEHKPDLVLVALGAPKQEKLIKQIYDRCQKGVFIGVGGSFDVLSGHKARAPKIMVKMHLEWMYRLMKEPNRIKKFVNNNALYFKKLSKIKAKK
ncbi:MAG: WecB/TagA/CpsF family glycosyltransferase [Clostridiaceae bacterium]